MKRIDPTLAKEFNETIGALLADLRRSRHLTRREVTSIITPLNAQQLQRIERGRCSISACIFYELVELYRGNWGEVECALFEAGQRMRVGIKISGSKSNWYLGREEKIVPPQATPSIGGQNENSFV